MSEQRIQRAEVYAREIVVGCPVGHMRSGMSLAGTPAGDTGGMACDSCVQVATHARDAAIIEAAIEAVWEHAGREHTHCRAAAAIRTALAHLLEEKK